jgi:hypothetical protein
VAGTGRVQSLATIGLVSVLAGGFGLWSAFSGPNVFEVQLHDAAANTLAASGFVETLQLTYTGSNQESSSISHHTPVLTESIDYQAPDRFRVVESERDNRGKAKAELQVTQIGSECWFELGGQSGDEGCQTSGSDVLDVLQDLEHTSKATLSGGVYTLDLKDSPQFLSGVFGPVATIFKGLSVEVRLDGSYVSSVHIGIDAGPAPSEAGLGIGVVIRFTQVGSESPVVRPAGAPSPTATTFPAPVAPITTPTTSTPSTLAG